MLTPDQAEQLARWAGLRNLLVHLYLDVDHRILHDILKGELDQLRDYAASLVRAISDD